MATLSFYEELEYFQPEEFAHPTKMSEELLLRLDHVRSLAGVPIHITSSYRVGDPLSHGRGLAVDIRCRGGRQRLLIVQGALFAGFRRIGVYDRHIHLDIDPALPQDVLWVGKSK